MINLLFVIVSCATVIAGECRNYTCDSIVVRRLLDTNGMAFKEVRDVALGVQRITQLDLSGLGIKFLPQYIGNLSALRTLNLDYNSLSELPDSMAYLQSASMISLKNNKFRQFPSCLVPLKQWHMMRELYLDTNEIRVLPDSLVTLDLASFGISWNRLDIPLSPAIERYLRNTSGRIPLQRPPMSTMGNGVKYSMNAKFSRKAHRVRVDATGKVVPAARDNARGRLRCSYDQSSIRAR